MSIDAIKLMRLQSWLSPAFPIGAYSYSHGLERAFEQGAVRDRVTLVDWLDADLRHGAGRTDGIFFAQIWRAVNAGDAGGVASGPLTEPHRDPRASGDPVKASGGGEGGGAGSRAALHGKAAAYWVPAFAEMTAEAGTTAEDAASTATDAAWTAARASMTPGDVATPRMVPASNGQTTASESLAAAPGVTLPPGTEKAAHRHILAIAELAAAMRGTSELALESGQQGIAFLSAVRKGWADPGLDALAVALREANITPVLPVAAGMACAVHGIALETALPLYLHAGAANLINAAVRLIPLGQSDGQMALATLETAVADTAAEALHSGLSEIGSAAFMIDIASMQHETQYTRLFRS